MTPSDTHSSIDPRHAGRAAKVYDRPGALAMAVRPVSLILVAVLAALVGYLVYYKYVL